MKKILLFFACITFFASCSSTIQITDTNREVNNFIYNDGAVSWSNIYSFNPSERDAIYDWFQSNFKVTKESANSITAETNQSALPIEEAGLNKMSVVMLLQHPCVVYFNTDFKNDRFRVIVNRIIWTPQVAVTSYGITQGVGTISLSEMAVKNGGYNSIFYNSTSSQLNTILTYLFTPKLNTKQNDNW